MEVHIVLLDLRKLLLHNFIIKFQILKRARLIETKNGNAFIYIMIVTSFSFPYM